ncbi:ZZ-type zinc finger-containing protein 3 [Galendromus occidentalis]|uniref:ZZ-type zinc finger-containing protein 3 n=1 Tax=Galendromus occidentalis TaxID=34638 RepID=A0AAJ6QP65_9ACAR|nr:ZZ-type zinc finger-containing protein 3 [Galendromus occidentalis]
MEENAGDHDIIAPGNFLVTAEEELGSLLDPSNDAFGNVAFETEVTVQDEEDEEPMEDNSQEASSEELSPKREKDEDEVPSSSTAHMSLNEMQRQVFSFETDHLALRANDEYKSVLKLLVLLEAQRMTAIQDLNTLAREKRAALSNPAEFVRKLQEGTLDLPLRQSIPEVPEVDLAKYSISAKFASACPQLTRAAGVEPSTSSTQELKSTKKARHLPKQASKPETFNKPWSIEEQLKLEELLVKHPPQVVEAGRWKKIAEELGNRTVKQVASRVQKYFIKLTKAGLQVPGRVPHIPKTGKKVRKVQSTLKTHSYYLSTFFPQHNTTVSLDDEPVAEYTVVKEEPDKVEQCATCSKLISDSAFRIHCKDCDAVFCTEDSCQQSSECAKSEHDLKLESRLQVDEDYIIDNHYLDPNYFPSKT